MNDFAAMNVVDLLHLASSRRIIDDYRFLDSGVQIREGSAEFFFPHDEAAMFLRGLLSWYMQTSYDAASGTGDAAGATAGA